MSDTSKNLQDSSTKIVEDRRSLCPLVAADLMTKTPINLAELSLWRREPIDAVAMKAHQADWTLFEYRTKWHIKRYIVVETLSQLRYCSE